MPFRMIAVRDRDLSLWQSAVEEVTSHFTDETRKNAMRIAAALHAQAETKGQAPATQAVTAESLANNEPAALASISKAVFDFANAHRIDPSSTAVALSALAALVRGYSTLDLLGWMQCMTRYTEYYVLGHAQPVYVDWQTRTPADISFGMIDYRLPATCKVLLLGDWGTHMSDNVAMLRQALRQLKPDAILHLGDVYYSGTSFECKRNVLDVMSSLVTELNIVRPPFFTIPGNHEYYSGGRGFYDTIAAVNSGVTSAQQRASYFCLRTADDRWQFLAMDTGLNDRDPSHHMAPYLQPSELTWHRDKLDHFTGSTILLSHHQLFSAHDTLTNGTYLNDNLKGAFAPYFDRVAAWFWGHEHNLVFFKDGQFGLRKGRLIGCSAYEEATDENPYANNSNGTVLFMDNMKMLDKSPNATQAKTFYNHAFALLEVSPAGVKASYYQYPSWDQSYNKPQPALGSPLFVETIAASPPPGV